MTAAAPLPLNNDAPDDWARPMFERQLAVLGHLAEAGLEIALVLERQVKAAEAANAPLPERAAIDYGRIARAVRQTLMLQSDLIRRLKDYDRNATFRSRTERSARAKERQARIERIVERVVHDKAENAEAAERLTREALERLDHDDFYGDLLARPVSDLVAVICQDLGLAPDWSKLAQEAWAREEMESGEVGWPLSLKALPP